MKSNKKIFFVFVMAAIITGCSTLTKTTSQNQEYLQNLIDIEDYRIRGTYGTENDFDISKINLAEYNKYQLQSQADPAKALRELLKEFDHQELTAYNNTFVFCGYSSKLQIAFCDDARCSKTDYFEKASSPKILETWKTKLPLNQCPNSQATTPQPPTPGAPTMSALKVSPTDEIILDHQYFKVSYNKDHKLPNWVSYHLSASNLRKKVAKRRDRFLPDPKLISLKVAYATPSDFDGKIYDRGHLAPSEDFVWSQAANDQTFVMSNMTLQKAKLNRGPWKTLETKVRKWACTEEELTVISGPILEKGLKQFPSKVSIPKMFFKVVIDETEPRKAIAFIFTQDDKKFDLEKEAVSIAEVEKLAGIDFENESNLDAKEYRTIRDHFKVDDWVEADCVRKVARQN